MKAFLLAAGLGTRLKPITDKIPKCLVEICNKPLLGWWIDLMEKHGIDEVLINLHHFPDQVKGFIEDHKTTIKFNFFFEEKLIGSGGTLRENKNFVSNEKEFFIFYAENLTNYNLTEFLSFHKDKKQPLTMALFNTNKPTACGIALLNEESIIVDFEEKPKQPKSNLANAGLFIAKPQVLDLIPNYELTDIGFHLLPQLINRMAGWKTDDYLMDIGTIQNLEKANREWKNIINNN